MAGADTPPMMLDAPRPGETGRPFKIYHSSTNRAVAVP